MFIEFNTPQNLNGEELVAELKLAGVVVSGRPSIDGLGKLWLDIEESNYSAAAAVVAAHNGTTVAPEPTIADKLASVGLSLDELKAAILGGN